MEMMEQGKKLKDVKMHCFYGRRGTDEITKCMFKYVNALFGNRFQCSVLRCDANFALTYVGSTCSFKERTFILEYIVLRDSNTHKSQSILLPLVVIKSGRIKVM